MKNWKSLLTVTTAAAISLCAVSAVAKSVKKNDPDKRDVLKELEEIGGEHYVERMKINQVGSLKIEKPDGKETYYHVYNVTLKKAGYRIVIYDNTPTYLGYYPSDFEAVDYEDEAILLDSTETDSEGGTEYYRLPIPSKGPADRAKINKVPTKFVKNPKLEAKNTVATGETPILVVPKEKSSTGVEIDYRDWKITIQGKERIYNAKFVSKSKDGRKVKIIDSKRGRTAEVPISALSDDDKEYLKSIGEL